MNSLGQVYDILALDVGTVRVGVARASSIARLAEPLMTVANDSQLWDTLRMLCEEHNVGQLVVGLPRNLKGEDTAQTKAIREFVEQLTAHIHIPIELQDEALTSHQAENELAERGKPFTKGDIDALAATYILEDYLKRNT